MLPDFAFGYITCSILWPNAVLPSFEFKSRMEWFLGPGFHASDARKRLQYTLEVPGLWSILNAEVVTENGIPVGTKTPTQHTVLASFRLEGPNGKRSVCFSPASDLRK
ncbi:uncharacterized protein DEA37_0012738 [Paragonimus westermani]|uniref:Uncharacterized protein n=1 Tax=Paragonimus westermani TaxID=34504 RepID=A0A5J4P093_9TREM|nr:uncharacterized protein DEA37_0012738 [Paragonimus westermani]